MSGLWLCQCYSMATMGWRDAFGHNFNSSQNIESVGSRDDVNAPFPTTKVPSQNIIHSRKAGFQNHPCPCIHVNNIHVNNNHVNNIHVHFPKKFMPESIDKPHAILNGRLFSLHILFCSQC